MTLLLLILFISTLIFLFYYELIWKKVEQDRGESLVSMARDFFAESSDLLDSAKARTASSAAETNWSDWKYRLLVELHRRGRLNSQEAANIVGISSDRIEKYLDILESEGRVQQVGDLERGIFYKVVNE